MPRLTSLAHCKWRAICTRYLIAILTVAGLSTPLGSAALEPDRDALELFKARLLQTGARLRAYPMEAIERNLAGTVLVTITIDATGKLARNVLAKSSGHAVLDEHALFMLEKAVPATEIPGALRNLAFTMDVVVIFALPDPPGRLGWLRQ